MKSKMRLLASASIVLMMAGGAAFAQEASQGTVAASTDQTATEKAKDKDDSTVIVVKGYRASLRSAQQIKRRSDSIIDAVVAEDIGKLPDVNAAESLARLPGVQITHGSDEGSGVLVRGLPDVATTVNGRDISTAELRRVQMQDFPSGALAGMEVYKSGTADLLEPGLAGLINVRTRRPFDFKGFEIDGAIRETYNDQNGKYNTNGNVLITDRWNTGAGEMGALLNLSYTEQDFRNAVRWADGYIGSADVNGQTIRFPNSVGVYMDTGHRWRPSANATLQWRPNDQVEVYADLLWQAYRAEHANDWAQAPLWNGTKSNVVLQDGTDQVLSMTNTGGDPILFYRSTGFDRTDTQQIAVGGSFTSGKLKLSTDLAYTNSLYSNSSWSLDSAINKSYPINVNFVSDGGTAWNAVGMDVSDASNYIWRGYYESIYKVGGNGIQWRGDAVYDTEWGIFKQLKAGLRYSDRNAFYEANDRYAWVLPLAIPFDSIPVGELSLTQDTFRGGDQGFRSYLQPSRAGIVDNRQALLSVTRDALAQLVALNPTDQGWKNTQTQWQPDLMPYNPYRGFTAKEATRTGYIQGRYETHFFKSEVDGNIGVRIVNTMGKYSGVSSVTWDGVTTAVPHTISQNYTDVLPNVSMRLRPNDQMQIRLGITKTRTRPDFGQLNPALNISQYVPNGTPVPNAADAYGSAGNPDLKPLTSTNYDVTWEYYPSGNTSASVAVFYHDLFGFINNYTSRVNDPTYGVLEVSRPENAGAGKIKGIEIAGQTFFDFLPGAWNGIGVQSNLTYIDAYNELPAALGGAGQMVKIPGVSNWSYNLAVFYEKDKISTRLSYNGRSRWINSYDNRSGGWEGEGTEAVNRLDYSFSYSPNDAYTLNFDVSNILAKPFHNFHEYEAGKRFVRDIRDEGRYYGLSVRFKYN
ncbi:TonB-dependent receptor [Asticcacaulis taihuensis]|uniref:TonB-dependent receptor n=2 Tax=Asticcacaulis taihuensis TaxID=260084 RepID=A0A1G4SIX0_9CAUL|nr:TonB-dependent receptor [Asticcacaulis taihuensis]